MNRYYWVNGVVDNLLCWRRWEARRRHVVYREAAVQALRPPQALDDLPGSDLQGKGNAASWNWRVIALSCPFFSAAGVPGALAEGDWY